ncbi:hypothetical protein GCM10010124_39710 [Pilimelia terevasa]|uniref:Uncharacterized protein n=1 Tax=Pilimelia terevasa TaxID=53372 RepID=A0A8J3BUZ4_9ACTN|nr:hypothetical protein [Pilimelia terevasa]GGK42943.1 hypothetical protein GCM10010124_39710 [Pilimelia terevasa]
MTTAIEAPDTSTAPDSPATSPAGRPRGRRAAAYVGGAVAAGAVGALLGWQGPALLDGFGAGYVGQPAAALAEDLRCTGYQPLRADSGTYPHHERGTCALDGTRVTVVTFDRASDVTAFTTLMNGVVPLMHPTWRQATIATGEGWAAFDTASMTQGVAETAVLRVGAGATHVVPSR